VQIVQTLACNAISAARSLALLQLLDFGYATIVAVQSTKLLVDLASIVKYRNIYK